MLFVLPQPAVMVKTDQIMLVTLVEPENERSARGIRVGSDDRGLPQQESGPITIEEDTQSVPSGIGTIHALPLHPTHPTEPVPQEAFPETAVKENQGVEKPLPPVLQVMHKTGEGDKGENGSGWDRGNNSSNETDPIFNKEELKLKAFLDEVRSRIDQAKRYPWLARLQGIEGMTHLSFRILPSGEPIDIQILQSSQSRLLDEEAITTVKRAARFPQPPVTSSLGVVVRLPLIFHLEGRSHRNE